MTIPKIGKNKILIIALVIVVVVGFYIFKSVKPKEEPLTTVQSGATGGISQEIIIELNRLKALRNIDDSIFKNPTFTSLRDYTQAVVPQPIGRNNPFAPIGTSGN